MRLHSVNNAEAELEKNEWAKKLLEEMLAGIFEISKKTDVQGDD